MSKEKTEGLPSLAYHGDIPKILRLLAQQIESGEATADRYAMELTEDRADVRIGLNLATQRSTRR